ncbi:hypothetical protein GCM10007320_52960 [Pseudorhodoferax aquiterrae]|uniref:Uncharacterized protein n=1 Tax=Pseudorhodoferax aquiterrae TaxID=747304 RepID=A0ABQ3G9V7_9BURK|nr:hypothetical protein GCM10007320_52960 [Pseudorhodoferax aquiterrae]
MANANGSSSFAMAGGRGVALAAAVRQNGACAAQEADEAQADDQDEDEVLQELGHASRHPETKVQKSSSGPAGGAVNSASNLHARSGARRPRRQI